MRHTYRTPKLVVGAVPPAPVSRTVAVVPPDRAAMRLAYQGWTAPIGTDVEVSRDDGSTYRSKTKSMPWLAGSVPMPLITVTMPDRADPGAILLTRVRVLEATAPAGSTP